MLKLLRMILGKTSLLVMLIAILAICGLNLMDEVNTNKETPPINDSSAIPKPKGLTVAEAKEVIQSIHNILDIQVKNLRYVISPGTEINAYATGDGRVIITQGMLDFVKSKEELAVVIGHEIAHHMLGHTSGIQDKISYFDCTLYGASPFHSSIYREAMADIVGTQLADMAGYSECGGVSLWKRMRDNHGNDFQGSPTHPNLGSRIYLHEVMCR